MRRRRLERLISRAEAAISRGQTQEVSDALDEVRRLAPESEQIATLEQALATSRSHDPVPVVADPDLPLTTTTEEISEPIDEASDLPDIPPPVSTGRTQKVVVAVASLMVAAAGLLVWSIYTAPEEQLRGLFPSLADTPANPATRRVERAAGDTGRWAIVYTVRARSCGNRRGCRRPATDNGCRAGPPGHHGRASAFDVWRASAAIDDAERIAQRSDWYVRRPFGDASRVTAAG